MTEEVSKGRRVSGDQRADLAKTAADRYVAGASIRALATELGRSYGFVHKLLGEAGVELRGRGGNNRGKK
ncbi:helix-turn-helix domain-containing protein [Actinocorallia longicatena]|uniref:Helix-turn-helix domain-containing protein n=1 Tax=Actinocorallia longicatena TaxID=111803 RepID=A0ABP6Q197_9ACTN